MGVGFANEVLLLPVPPRVARCSLVALLLPPLVKRKLPEPKGKCCWLAFHAHSTQPFFQADCATHLQPNNDFCDVCTGKGHFLCCDGGCLRSFHFACLDPPLEVDDVPDEAWYCKACRAARVCLSLSTKCVSNGQRVLGFTLFFLTSFLLAQNPPPKPPRGFFQELIYRVETENPKTFSLPAELKNFFKNGSFLFPPLSAEFHSSSSICI